MCVASPLPGAAQLGVTLLKDEAAWNQCDVLCACGPCDASLWRRLEKWLSKQADRTLLLLEAEGVTQRAPHPQVRCVRLADEERLRKLAWELVFLRFGYVAVGAVAEQDRLSWVEHYRQGIALLASDTKDLGVRVVSNAVHNLQMLPRSFFGPALKDLAQASQPLSAALALP